MLVVASNPEEKCFQLMLEGRSGTQRFKFSRKEDDFTLVEQIQKTPSHQAWGVFSARQKCLSRRHEALTEHWWQRLAGCWCTWARDRRWTCGRASTVYTRLAGLSATNGAPWVSTWVSRGRKLFTKQAAAWRTHYNSANVAADKPASAALQ